MHEQVYSEELNIKQMKTLWDLERKLNNQEKILPHHGNNFVALIEGKTLPYYALDRKQIGLERYRLNEISKYQSK